MYLEKFEYFILNSLLMLYFKSSFIFLYNKNYVLKMIIRMLLKCLSNCVDQIFVFYYYVDMEDCVCYLLIILGFSVNVQNFLLVSFVKMVGINFF